MQAFPNVLDLLVSTNKADGAKVELLRKALELLCITINGMRDHEKAGPQHVHECVKEW